MIDITNKKKLPPYNHFYKCYKEAEDSNQHPLNALSISSFNKDLNEVDSRYVNLKYITGEEWIFFTNYNSLKAQSFAQHNQISALIYWEKLNVQIRIKALIRKSSTEFNKKYFLNRSEKKNALAISSDQSKSIESFQAVKKKYEKSIESADLTDCPDYWGGYSFTPYYFEFWLGNESRLNKRDAYEIKNGEWQHSFLQP